MNFTLEGGPRRINPQYFDDFRSSEKKNLHGEAEHQVKQWGSKQRWGLNQQDLGIEVAKIDI